MRFVVYDDKGEILRSGSCPIEYISTQIGEGEYFLEGVASCKTHYIEGGRIKLKKDMPVKISGLEVYCPSGVEVFVDGEMLGVCETGVLSVDKPNEVDRYLLKLVNFPYMDYE